MEEKRDEKFMTLALEAAKEAYDIGEVPVGCVIVRGDEVVSVGYNKRESGKNALLHAEAEAIYKACRSLHGWRLFECEMYVTMEPCPMCAGAIVNSRIKRVVYGVRDEKAGAFGGVLNLNDFPLNHKPEIVSGVMETECRTLIQSFFANLRKRKKEEKDAT